MIGNPPPVDHTRRRSARASKMTPPSDVIRPPSNAAVTFPPTEVGQLPTSLLGANLGHPGLFDLHHITPQLLVEGRLHDPQTTLVVALGEVGRIRSGNEARRRLTPRAPHPGGKKTLHNSDLEDPGGTLMMSRRMSPAATASRCAQIASIVRPGVIATAGSRIGHISSTK